MYTATVNLIIPSHRLSTITHADEILVLHEGRIVQRGRHEALISQYGRYRSMWEKQTTTKKEQQLDIDP